MDRSVPPLPVRVLALLACVTVPLMLAAALTADSARHQTLISAAALVATLVAGHSAHRVRSPAQLALFAGIALWTAGSTVSSVLLLTDSYNAYPTAAEWLWLSSYPAFWAAVMLMIPRWGAGHWLDGVVACLGVAAAAAAVLMPKLTTTGLSPLGAAVAGAFAIGDLLLIGFTFAALVIARRPASTEWRRLTFGILLLAGTDLLFALRMAGMTDVAFASWMDIGWILGLVALSVVRPRCPRAEPEVGRQPLTPVLASAAALVVLVVDHYHRLADGALWLAVAALALGVARTVDAARASGRLAEAERLALTDDLTRVGNRRRLFRDLGDAFERGAGAHLALFDLNGFKARSTTARATPPATPCSPSSAPACARRWRASAARTASAATSSACWWTRTPTTRSPARAPPCTAAASPPPPARSSSASRPAPRRRRYASPTRACTRTRRAART